MILAISDCRSSPSWPAFRLARASRSRCAKTSVSLVAAVLNGWIVAGVAAYVASVLLWLVVPSRLEVFVGPTRS
jgi:hypothetical protein